MLSKTSSQIASGYRKKLNSSKIFFKNQFSYIHQNLANSEKYTHFELEEFTSFLGKLIFYLMSVYMVIKQTKNQMFLKWLLNQINF